MYRSPALSISRGLAIAFLTGLFMAAGLNQAEARRLALVVGNSAYTAVPALKNAGKDAQDVAAALERLGFEVTLLQDTSAADFWARIDAFSAEAQTAEATAFYYSGHAFQMNGQNYLVPVDARLTSREALRSETLNLDSIIARLQDRKRQTLIFLDACRNDPLPQLVRGSGVADGLARLQTGVGTFVAFATEPGGVTFDGAGGDAPNSPFTTALLANLETAGLSISDMMIKVRNDVSEATAGLQTPWDQSSLRQQFYFKAAVEKKQELSEADYELLAQLPPEDRKQFMELLAASGFDEASLQAADDAITVASYNLEVAAESEVSVVAAPAGTPVAPVDELPEQDITKLEIVDGGQTVGVAGGDAAPAGGVTEQVAALGPTPEPSVSTEVPAGPVAEAPAPEAPVAVAETPAPEEPVVVAEAPAPAEPVVVAEATAPDEPVVVAEAPAPEEPVVVAEAPAPEEPVVVAEAPAPEEPVVAAEAPIVIADAPPDPVPPVTSTIIERVPETVIAGLPTPEGQAPLGADAPDAGPPIRLAALTWQTRGILGLNAVDADRERVTGSEITPDNDTNRAILAAIDPSLLDDTGITIDEGDLARTAQQELARLGCYRMKVDGSWGKGSRTALTSYFLAKKQVPTSLEPTAELVTKLKADTQVVCAVQVARAKVVVGKTKPILPQKAAAQKDNAASGYKPKPKKGNTVATPTERKKEIKKGLLNAGTF